MSLGCVQSRNLRARTFEGGAHVVFCTTQFVVGVVASHSIAMCVRGIDPVGITSGARQGEACAFWGATAIVVHVCASDILTQHLS